MQLNIELTLEEAASLEALAVLKATTPEKILQQFASEITSSLRSRGSDERMYAEQWFERTFMRFTPLTDGERERYDNLTNQAYQFRQRGSR